MTDRIALAAHARAEVVRQRTDRPRQRSAGGYAFSSQIDDSDGYVHFVGLASAYNTPYEMYDEFGPYTEIVMPGAGARSLARPNLDVTLNIGHDQMRKLARTTNGSLKLSETSEGLTVDAPQLDLNDPDVAYIVPKLRSGLITEMSFAFRDMVGVWSDDFTTYRMTSYELHRGDVALVGYGANPHTSANLRSGRELISLEEIEILDYL
jgi:HK97 family phage prohead protease